MNDNKINEDIRANERENICLCVHVEPFEEEAFELQTQVSRGQIIDQYESVIGRLPKNEIPNCVYTVSDSIPLVKFIYT